MTVAPSAIWTDAYRQELVRRAALWQKHGAVVLPVIPVALPAERWGRTNKDGSKDAIFPGKAPSYWNPKTGEPQLITRKGKEEKFATKEFQQSVLEVLGQPVEIGAAAEFGGAMGFCILPTPDLVVVDLDATEHREKLVQKAMAEGHYIESTPSGGLHVVLNPEDQMASWVSKQTSSKTSFYTNWGFSPDGDHLGEVLCGGKVCLMAPTVRGDGRQYQVLSGMSAEFVFACDDITSALGIHPIASKAQREKARKQQAQQDSPPPPQQERRSTANRQEIPTHATLWASWLKGCWLVISGFMETPQTIAARCSQPLQTRLMEPKTGCAKRASGLTRPPIN